MTLLQQQVWSARHFCTVIHSFIRLFEDTIIGVKQDFKAGKPALTKALNTIKDKKQIIIR